VATKVDGVLGVGAGLGLGTLFFSSLFTIGYIGLGVPFEQPPLLISLAIFLSCYITLKAPLRIAWNFSRNLRVAMERLQVVVSTWQQLGQTETGRMGTTAAIASLPFVVGSIFTFLGLTGVAGVLEYFAFISVFAATSGYKGNLRKVASKLVSFIGWNFSLGGETWNQIKGLKGALFHPNDEMIQIEISLARNVSSSLFIHQMDEFPHPEQNNHMSFFLESQLSAQFVKSFVEKWRSQA
jgi:hypothetical protein